MVEITQRKINNSTFAKMCDKMNEVSISINTELIKSDLSRLDEMMNSTSNRYDKTNIKALMLYLSKIISEVKDGSRFELCWNINSRDGLPYTYPLKFINEPIYKIDICNYIELSEGEQLVEMNMTDLADIIAFEIMYRDLGETHDSIENLLEGCGIIGLEPASILTNVFKQNGDRIYQLSKSMKIGDTPYYSPETRKVNDYFCSKQFKTKEYREIVNYSCRYANSMIVESILKKDISCNANVRVVMISADTIAFIANVSNEFNIKKELIEEISVRAFGRHFKIEPEIQIF